MLVINVGVSPIKGKPERLKAQVGGFRVLEKGEIKWAPNVTSE